MSAADATPDPFDCATYYGAGDDERLSFESPEEHLLDLLYGFMPTTPTSPAALDAALDDMAPIEVTAYERDPVATNWSTLLAEHLGDLLDEQFLDDYGDPDGEQGIEDKPAAVAAFKNAIDGALEASCVWRCSPVGTRSYDADALRAMVLHESPDWLRECPECGNAPSFDRFANAWDACHQLDCSRRGPRPAIVNTGNGA